VREQIPGPLRDRQSPRSFALSIPAPAQLAQVDEHSMELYVITPDGIPVTHQVHAAVLICVKTAAIMSALLTLGPLKEEDYMRLVKGMLEPKDRLVLQADCQHSWPCYGKPAVIFHDRGKIFTSQRARQVLVDRLGIITEQAPPYCPSAKGTVEALFRWMTQRFERRLPNTSHGIHDAEVAARAGGMTLEELERYFYRAIVDDYQQSWDGVRRQIRSVLWEEAVRQTGVPHYLGAPDDLKLLLMKAQNRKAGGHAYRVHDRSRLSFQGHWYTCPGLLSRLSHREFEIYYDRRDISVIYLFVEGSYVGEAYCQAFMGRRVSEWEAAAMRKHDREKAKAAAAASAEVRARMQEEIEEAKKQRRRASRESEKARQLDRQREEIHPPHVLEALESLAPPKSESLKLPKAIPDPPKEYPVQHLAIRYREREQEP
jgi:Mu transposase, C-terminal